MRAAVMITFTRVLKLACSLFAIQIEKCEPAYYQAQFHFKFFGMLSKNSHQTIFSGTAATFGESLKLCTNFCIADQRCIGIETCQVKEDQFQCRVCCDWKITGKGAEEKPGCKYLEMVSIFFLSLLR
jgi:hypothetical protein